MTNWSQPTTITITTPGQPETINDRPTMSYPLVKRRVAPGRTLEWLGHDYAAGAIIELRSDLAFPHERRGVLVPV